MADEGRGTKITARPFRKTKPETRLALNLFQTDQKQDPLAPSMQPPQSPQLDLGVWLKGFIVEIEG